MGAKIADQDSFIDPARHVRSPLRRMTLLQLMPLKTDVVLAAPAAASRVTSQLPCPEQVGACPSTGNCARQRIVLFLFLSSMTLGRQWTPPAPATLSISLTF